MEQSEFDGTSAGTCTSTRAFLGRLHAIHACNIHEGTGNLERMYNLFASTTRRYHLLLHVSSSSDSNTVDSHLLLIVRVTQRSRSSYSEVMVALPSNIIYGISAFLLLQGFSSVTVVVAWSNNHSPRIFNRPVDPDASPSSSPSTTPSPSMWTTRRKWISSSIFALATSVTAAGNSHAACLPGDLSRECIGVYKVPIDDRILPYVATPEALKRFAPDLNYVPPIAVPNSVALAWEILETQRLAVDDIQQVVKAGRLEEAGIKVLNLVPKVTQSGRVILEDSLLKIVNSLSSTSTSAVAEMTMNRLESQWEMVLGLWGEADVMIGQGLKGDLGVSAVAQIYILKQIADATAAMDDFMASAAVASGKVRSN